jgi:methyl-accepting chemotaxis protein
MRKLSVSRLENLSIRSKILTCFAAILVVLVGLGANALQRASAMNEEISNITRNYGLAIVYLDEMRVSVAQYRALLARLILQSDDKAARQASMGMFEELVKTFDQNNSQYGPTVDPGEEAGLYAELNAAWSAYMIEAKRVQEIVAAEKPAEASVYLLQHALPKAVRAEQAVHASMNYNTSAMKRHTADVDASYTTGRTMIIGFMSFAVVAAVMAGMFLVRSIATPVKQMTEAMRKLAARDLTTGVPAQDRTDEIGHMAAAVQVFKEGLIAAQRWRASRKSTG